MTVCQPVAELLRIALRYETEKRWFQAAAAYQEALDNMSRPPDLTQASDRELLAGLMRVCVWRSRETTSLPFTVVSEEVKAAADRKGERAAQRREALVTARLLRELAAGDPDP